MALKNGLFSTVRWVECSECRGLTRMVKPWQRFCSGKCRMRRWRRRQAELHIVSPMATGTPIAEFRVGQCVRVLLDGREAEGYIMSCHVRFWHTEELRRYRYEVRFAKKFWGCWVYTLDADKLEVLG